MFIVLDPIMRLGNLKMGWMVNPRNMIIAGHGNTIIHHSEISNNNKLDKDSILMDTGTHMIDS